EFLRKQGARHPDQYWPKIDDYQLHSTSVRVRLFYRDGKRQFPASREMKLPVRYVLGHYVDQSMECFLSDFDIVFHCPVMRELPQLIEESVRGAAAQIDSRQLLAATPPAQSELRIVRVRLKEPRLAAAEPIAETLTLVADPVIKKRSRRNTAPTKHRDQEVEQVLAAMSDTSLLLVGPSGCGKTTVAHLAAGQHQAAARQAAKLEGNSPPPPRVWETSAENLIAGMQYLGEWEQRLEQVIADLESIGGVLLISSLVDLIRLGGTQPTDSLAAFLMPYVRRGEVRLMIETTADELNVARRLLPGWAECFQIVAIDPLSHDQTCDIATTMLAAASRNHQIEVDDVAAETTTRLFAQFMPYQAPPRGVVQLIADVIEQARAEARRASPPPRIKVAQIIDRFTRLTGLPEAMLRDSMTLQAETVRAKLRSSVIGQESAVRSVSNAVLRLKAGLCDSRRPVATMMFCGPTGVGKTQLARSLADYLFGQSELQHKTLLRLDMSEYSGWDAVDRFLMGADGEVAAWIGALRARPMSVVLLDEFEKSSPEVHDCLLSALDEGRLSDRFGRTTTLCGAILVLTSNVGSKSTESIGFSGHDSGAIRRAIEHEFRPEFLNRLDEIVTFDALPPNVIEQIVEKELRALRQREALTSRGVRLSWDDSVVSKIAAVGFDPLLGARPLQRAIEQEVVAKIARRLLDRRDQKAPILIDLCELVG
ncbi:MAG: AAA family ATPase, partial [Pirellulales bacterium]|nr:AAA family ATPase [Pirellulales bacterium]